MDKKAIEYAENNKIAPNIQYTSGNPIKGLPFMDETFDIVVLFQVIEHIKPTQIIAFLKEISRVLKPQSKLLLTTPNRKLRLLPFQRPWNKYHKKEYNSKELRKILEQIFPSVQILGLTGKEEIIRIELERVKQNPLKVYIKNPLVRLLKWLLPKQIIQLLTILRDSFHSCNDLESREVRGMRSPSNFSLDDLYFRQSRLGEAIDFMAICKTSPKA